MNTNIKVISMVPGGGKTQLIVAGIEEAIRHRLQPKYIYAITFTREAALSLNQRTNNDINASTIHSLAASIIKNAGGYINTLGFAVYDYIIADAISILRSGNGPRIDLLCIDEAQDLNRLQFEFINELCKCAINIIVVGDEFQSIYSFQGGSPEYIKQIADNFETDIITAGISHRLPVSIAKYLNRIFGKNIVSSDQHMGSVNVISEGEAKSRVYLHKIYDMFLDQHPGTSGILFRTNAEVSAFVMSSGKATSFNYSIDIRDHPFFALVSFMYNKDHYVDFKSLSILADYMGFGIYAFTSFLDMVDEVSLKKKTFVPSAKILEKIKHTGSLAGVAVQSVVFSCLDGLLDSLKYYDLPLILTHDGLTNYMIECRDLGFDIEKFYDFGDDIIIQKILEYFDNGNSICRIDNDSPWSVMTVHAAKGLEFDNVLYQLNRFMSTTDPEEYRISYVAMSRARENLLVYVPYNKYAVPEEPNLYHTILRNAGGI